MLHKLMNSYGWLCASILCLFYSQPLLAGNAGGLQIHDFIAATSTFLVLGFGGAAVCSGLKFAQGDCVKVGRVFVYVLGVITAVVSSQMLISFLSSR